MPTRTRTSPFQAARPAVRVEFTRPKLYPKQLEAIYADERYSVIEASTKSGKTVGCMCWLAEQAWLGKPGWEFWWIAPIYEQARIVFRRLTRGMPSHSFVANQADCSITLANGAVLRFKGADNPDSLYGEDVHAAVIDEATRVKEDAWHAVRTTLTATRGRVRIIGNVKGRRNWAYRLARRAESGAADMHYARITAYDAIQAGVLDQHEIDDARAQLPEQVFRELYEAVPSDDEGNPFGIAAIQACLEPLHAECKPLVWGWDLARANDWTWGIGLCEHGCVAQSERWNQSNYPALDADNSGESAHPEYWDITLRRVRDLTGKLPAAVDSTGPGGPIDQALNQSGYRNMEGYVFNQRSKQLLMEGLAVAIQQRDVGFPSGILQLELESFEYAYSRTGVHYCVAMDTPVLTWDLRWVPAASLVEGDDLLAFDELALAGPKSRRWRCATVTNAGRVVRPTYRLCLEDGTELIASQEHLWLTGEHRLEWRRTDELRGRHPTSKSPRDAPRQLVRLLNVWDEPTSYEAGYLAAAFDGEGSLSQLPASPHPGYKLRLHFAQRDNAMADQVRRYLRQFGFNWAENTNERSGVVGFGLTGRRAEVLRFLGQIRPKRLLEKFDAAKLGTLDKLQSVPISHIEYLGEQELVALGTTTRTFIANGFASHNSAPEGMHDDGVCALALAWWKFSQLGRYRMLETLLSQPATLRHRGTLVGGRQHPRGERNPLDA